MKIRTGFVSNSSSSSFVIIGRKDDLYIPGKDNLPGGGVFGTRGRTDFGWGPEVIDDMWSRINFAYLQCLYAENYHPEWKEMLFDVLAEGFNCSPSAIMFAFDLGYGENAWKKADYIHAYIDHQSCASNDKNTGIFDNRYCLFSFIFSNGSYIKLDHDNH